MDANIPVLDTVLGASLEVLSLYVLPVATKSVNGIDKDLVLAQMSAHCILKTEPYEHTPVSRHLLRTKTLHLSPHSVSQLERIWRRTSANLRVEFLEPTTLATDFQLKA